MDKVLSLLAGRKYESVGHKSHLIGIKDTKLVYKPLKMKPILVDQIPEVSELNTSYRNN